MRDFWSLYVKLNTVLRCHQKIQKVLIKLLNINKSILKIYILIDEKEDPKPDKPGASSDSTAGMSMEHLRRYLAEKLGFYDDDDERSETEKPKVLK